jgi:RimJ/RimL family protein N-acetyltransferase
VDLGAIELTSERLVLKPCRPEDTPEVFAPITPTLARWMSWEPARSIEELETVFAAMAERTAAGREVALVARRAADGEFLGMTGLNALDTAEPETGIWIKESAHRQGFGRECVTAVLGFAGEVLGLPALVYPVVEENLPSRRLAQSLGGVIVGARILTKPSGLRRPMVVYRIPTARPAP